MPTRVCHGRFQEAETYLPNTGLMFSHYSVYFIYNVYVFYSYIYFSVACELNSSSIGILVSSKFYLQLTPLNRDTSALSRLNRLTGVSIKRS